MRKRPTVERRRGFTLVELVFVMIIVGVLSLIIVPKFTGRVSASKIAATKANIESIRTAVELYVADNGKNPNGSLTDLTKNGYLRKIPQEAVTPSGKVVGKKSNKGGWHYNKKTGAVAVNLNGKDADGTKYSDY